MKSWIHFCPFCSNRLEIWPSVYHTTYACINEGCVVDDMPRYQVTYNSYPTKLLSTTFMLDKYYIQISHLNNTTTISILEGCLLLNTIEIPKLFPLDFEQIDEYLKKIKTILVFS